MGFDRCADCQSRNIVRVEICSRCRVEQTRTNATSPFELFVNVEDYAAAAEHRIKQWAVCSDCAIALRAWMAR
jgi:hypothetical protein